MRAAVMVRGSGVCAAAPSSSSAGALHAGRYAARLAGRPLQPGRPWVAPRQRHLVRAENEGSGDKNTMAVVGEKVEKAGAKAAEVTGQVGDWYNRNIGDYCSLDSTGHRQDRSLGEMEQDFLAALSSFYYDHKPIMSDEEFENLREELLWNGSKVAILSSNEQRFMEASLAYQRGESILSDDEYDTLKAKLRERNSIVAAQGPRCSIRSRNMYSDAIPDYLKMTLLNLPAAVLVLALVFSIDDLTGFEITQLIELPPPFGVVLLWGVLLPLVYVVATSLTNVVLRDGIILRANCPSCGADNNTYFGKIFSVAGNKGRNSVTCGGCKSALTFDQAKRIVVCTASPGEGEKELKAAKKGPASNGPSPKGPESKKPADKEPADKEPAAKG